MGATGEVVRVVETEAAEMGAAREVAAMAVAMVEVVRVAATVAAEREVETVAAEKGAAREVAATVEEVKVAATVVAARAAATGTTCVSSR